MKLTKKIANLFYGKKRAAQERREKRFFDQYKTSSMKLARLYYPANSPDEFLKALNSYMLAVDGFKGFTLKDVRVYNIFGPKNNEFLKTIYAIKRSYGYFYVAVGDYNIFWTQEEARITPTKHFRVYLENDLFARCFLRRGIVMVSGIFEEMQSCSGEYYSEEYSTKFSFPCKLESISL